MMEEEFFATIKLSSGEEIISRVAYVPDDDMVIIHDPLKVEHITHQKKKITVEGFHLTEWMHSTFDDMFFIPKTQILTMTECDKKVVSFYIKCLSDNKKAKDLARFQNQTKNGNPQKVLPGYIGSVKQSRIMLEKIFKTS